MNGFLENSFIAISRESNNFVLPEVLKISEKKQEFFKNIHWDFS